ncbi:MAG: FRG domain-containing protein [Chloroflexi bacterium]|nr:FRG domain-containing protein [Chloroflexota bacterium]
MESAFHFLEVTPKSWNTAKSINDQLVRYSFRGQSDCNLGLTTTIERLADQFSMKKSAIGNREGYILEKFKSRAHQYIQAPPATQNNIEWLSIIQDYGGPTRLLDFTHSFYIAAFFALESAKDDACVWAISDYDLWNRFVNSHVSLLKSDTTYFLYNPDQCNDFAEIFLADQTKSEDFIVKIIPPRLNERLAAQKGFFLFNCNAHESFEHGLCKTFKFPFDKLEDKNIVQLSATAFLKNKSVRRNKEELLEPNLYGHVTAAPIIKIRLLKKYRMQALIDLDNMNINHASLFPGLEGYAKSMKLNMLFTNKDIAFQYRIGKTTKTETEKA